MLAVEGESKGNPPERELKRNRLDSGRNDLSAAKKKIEAKNIIATVTTAAVEWMGTAHGGGGQEATTVGKTRCGNWKAPCSAVKLLTPQTTGRKKDKKPPTDPTPRAGRGRWQLSDRM